MKLNIDLSKVKNLSKLVGAQDRNLKILKSFYGYQFSILNNDIVTDAPTEKFNKFEEIFNLLIELSEREMSFNERDVIYIIKSVENNKGDLIIPLYTSRKRVILTDQGRPIYPKTINQSKYVKTISDNALTFGYGPAGTGKTYLAVAMAAAAFKSNQVKKLILTRPAVEAGESLGFLPGDLKEKVDPYLIPLYDALYEILGKVQTDDLIEKGFIEIAPLAYMRGRTLDHSFIILDEAQNTTENQMKMILTRLGFSSKMVITGDPSQTDLKKGQISGLKKALDLLKNIDSVSFIKFDIIDVIRHPLVQRILERYEK